MGHCFAYPHISLSSRYSLLVFDKGTDNYISIVYIVITALFLFEFILLLILQEGFAANSVFLWFDIFSILSMAIDCVPLSYYSYLEAESFFSNLINAIRIVRLFRLWRIFRIIKLIDIYLNSNTSFAYHLGQSLSTFLSMKLGFIIVIVCAFITILKWDSNWIGPPMALQALEGLFDKYEYEFNVTQYILVTSYPVLKITIDNVTTFLDSSVNIDSYRIIELQNFTTPRSILIMDNVEAVQAVAIINIIMISIVLIFFLYPNRIHY